MASASPEERIERFTRLVERFPASEVPRFSLAQALFDGGRLEAAEATFAEVIHLRPDFLMAWVLRARALLLLERSEECRTVATAAKALAIRQGHSEPRAEAEAILEELEGNGG